MHRARPAPKLIQPAQAATRQGAPLGLLAFLGLLFAVQLSSEGALTAFLNVYFVKELLVSTGLTGTIFAVVRLLPFFVSPVLPLALNRWGSGRTMAASYGLLAAAALGIALFHHWAAAGAGFVLASLAASLASPARSLFGQEAVQPRWRATANAVTTISQACGGGLAGFAGGRLIELAGFHGLFLTSAALALAGVLIYAAGERRGAGSCGSKTAYSRS
jgi:MFS family permease